MTCGAAKRHGVYVHLHLPTVSGSDRHYTSRTPRSTCYVSRGQYHGSQGAISAVLLVRDATRWRGSGRVTCYIRWEGQYSIGCPKALKKSLATSVSKRVRPQTVGRATTTSSSEAKSTRNVRLSQPVKQSMLAIVCGHTPGCKLLLVVVRGVGVVVGGGRRAKMFITLFYFVNIIIQARRSQFRTGSNSRVWHGIRNRDGLRAEGKTGS